MRDKPDALLELALSISDGFATDWKAAANEELKDRERRLIPHLRAVEEIAEFHRSRQPTPETEPAARSSLREARMNGPTPASLLREAEGDGPTPSRWAHLELFEKIGEGSFAEVWRARDPKLERDVALKLFRPRTSLSTAGKETSAGAAVVAAIPEGRLLARVRHPNVVTVYGADTAEGRAGIWMELICGRTLEEILHTQGAFAAWEAARVGRDICRALAAVHGAGLLHRDLKAQNVLREEGGRIILTDFGLGRTLEEVSAVADHSPTGTPLYLAPEIFQAHPASVRSDIYSLGVLLFHLVTGSFPVTARTLTELREAHHGAHRRLLRDLRPDLPEGFIRLIERAVAIDPAERFGSCGEMEQALAAFLAREGTSQAGGSAGPVGRPTSRRGFLAVLAAGIALIALVPFAPAIWRWLSPGPLAYEIDAVFYRRGAESSDRLNSGARVAPGDRIYLELQSSTAVHVYVLNQDERGETFLLFPLPGYDLSNPLPSGSSHVLPGRREGRQAYWEVTSVGGRERILIVASPKRLSAFEADIESLAEPATGTPATAVLIKPGSLRRLRGLGAIQLGPDPESGGEPLFARALKLAGPEKAKGVWVRQIELENPASE